MSKLFGKRFHRGKHIGLSPFRKKKGRCRKEKGPKVQIQGVPGEGLFIVVDGKRIAERGACCWVTLEPGWTVIDKDDGSGCTIFFDEARH